MTDLWNETSDYDEAIDMRRREALAAARHHLAPTFAELLSATSEAGFQARLYLADGKINSVASSVSNGDPVLFAVVKDDITSRAAQTFQKWTAARTASVKAKVAGFGVDEDGAAWVKSLNLGDLEERAIALVPLMQYGPDYQRGVAEKLRDVSRELEHNSDYARSVFDALEGTVVRGEQWTYDTGAQVYKKASKNASKTAANGTIEVFPTDMLVGDQILGMPGKTVERVEYRGQVQDGIDKGDGSVYHIFLSDGTVLPAHTGRNGPFAGGKKRVIRHDPEGAPAFNPMNPEWAAARRASKTAVWSEWQTDELARSDRNPLRGGGASGPDVWFSDRDQRWHWSTGSPDDAGHQSGTADSEDAANERLRSATSSSDSPGYICTHEGCDYTGTKDELEKHTKDHTSADYDRVLSEAALVLADADEFFGDPIKGLAFTAVRHEGMVHWAFSDEEGEEAEGSGSAESVRDALQQARDTIDKVLNDNGGSSEQQEAPAEGAEPPQDAPEAPEQGDEAGEPVAEPEMETEEPQEVTDQPEAVEEAAPESPEAVEGDPEAPNPAQDMPEEEPGSDAAEVTQVAEDVSDGSIMEIDPTTMNTGDQVKMTYTLSDGTTGDVDVIFVRVDNDIYFFDGPNGEFGIGQRDEGTDTVWVDSEGQHFSFSDGDAMEEVTGEDVPADAQVDDVDIDAPVEGETKDAPPTEEAPAEEAPAEEPPAEEKASDDDEEEDEDFKKKVESIFAAMQKENPSFEEHDRLATLARRAARLSFEIGPIA